MKPNFMLHHYGKRWKAYSNDLGHLSLFIIFTPPPPPGAGAFSRDFTTFTPQCKAFSRALEIEKLKTLLFRGPEGAGNTNDLCIIGKYKVRTHLKLIKLTEFRGNILILDIRFAGIKVNV